MPRYRPPSTGYDPRNDLARSHFRQHDIATPGELRRAIEDERRTNPSTPRVRPILTGSWADGTAGHNLARILAELGLLIDQSEV